VHEARLAARIDKQVSLPVATGTLTCGTASYTEADTVATAAAYYRPGDRVCYRVRLTLNDQATSTGSALYFSNVDVTDFLPPGFTFEQLWGVKPTGQTSNDQITTAWAWGTRRWLSWLQAGLAAHASQASRPTSAMRRQTFTAGFSVMRQSPRRSGCRSRP